VAITMAPPSSNLFAATRAEQKRRLRYDRSTLMRDVEAKVTEAKPAGYGMAFHQAGHAVMAFSFEIGLRCVDIRESCEEHLSGLGSKWLNDAAERGGRRPLFDDWDRVRKEIVVILAGSIAESLAGVEPNAERAAYDDGQAANLAWLLCYSDEEFDAMFKWLRLHTRWFVTAGWNSISAVAEALIESGKLSGEEVGAIAVGVLAR
jgi:hypothetical protein